MVTSQWRVPPGRRLNGSVAEPAYGIINTQVLRALPAGSGQRAAGGG